MSSPAGALSRASLLGRHAALAERLHDGARPPCGSPPGSRSPRGVASTRVRGLLVVVAVGGDHHRRGFEPSERPRRGPPSASSVSTLTRVPPRSLRGWRGSRSRGPWPTSTSNALRQEGLHVDLQRAAAGGTSSGSARSPRCGPGRAPAVRRPGPRAAADHPAAAASASRATTGSAHAAADPAPRRRARRAGISAFRAPAWPTSAASHRTTVASANGSPRAS